MNLTDSILSFLKSLEIPAKLPKGVGVMNPYQDAEAFRICDKFYRKFYADQKSRTVILGINPGRFGGGITGVPFTDPVKLERFCDIPNDLPKKAELSADFIYALITSFGGPQSFYSKFYIGAVSPLGFTQNGKNMNYYDNKGLQEALGDFIISSLQSQLNWGLNKDVCFCLGEGKNFNYLLKLNKKHTFFKKIIPLAHPRFILQYRRKKAGAFIRDYLKAFNDHS